MQITHFMEAVQLVNEYGLTVIPVIEGEHEFHRCYPAGRSASSNWPSKQVQMSPEAVIVLELDKRGYSFSEISKLVETNDAQITQLNTYYDNTSKHSLSR